MVNSGAPATRDADDRSRRRLARRCDNRPPKLLTLAMPAGALPAGALRSVHWWYWQSGESRDVRTEGAGDLGRTVAVEDGGRRHGAGGRPERASRVHPRSG